MADREIYCYECDTYLGVIRDAKLKRGMVFLCADCGMVPEDTTTYNMNQPGSRDAAVEQLMNIFGMGGKR